MTYPASVVAGAQHKPLPLRVKDFLLLEESGAFANYARAELLDGEIWVLNAIYSPHAAAQGELQGQLWAALVAVAPDLRAYVTPSVEMGDSSLPEPDVVVTEPHDDGFLPFAKVKLVVEVSDTTLGVDLGRKLRLYAGAGIPEYWVADLNDRMLHKMWQPDGEKYARSQKITFGEPIDSACISGLRIESERL